jgi:hypothetical protein
MEITKEGDLNTENNNYPKLIRFFASLMGYFLHPVLIVSWVALYILFLNNQVFLGIDSSEKIVVFLRIFSTSSFLPLITVLLLKGLGFISSIKLETQKERIIPLVACITFFFWSFYVSRQLNDPAPLRAFLLALFLSSSAALMLNIYQKTSLHMIAGGVAAAFFTLLLFENLLNEPVSIISVYLLAGISGTSRLITMSHKSNEIWLGFFTGVIIQFIAWLIIF